MLLPNSHAGHAHDALTNGLFNGSKHFFSQ